MILSGPPMWIQAATFTATDVDLNMTAMMSQTTTTTLGTTQPKPWNGEGNGTRGRGTNVHFEVAWSMPSRWTFSVPPIKRFVEKWLVGAAVVVDPFCGQSSYGTLRNDLSNDGGMDAAEWCEALVATHERKADAVLFDPPYSPRQIAECYQAVRRNPTMEDTQSARLYRRVREPLKRLLKPGGVALSFGWQSSGFGKEFETREILLVRHGGAHNDTICVAQIAPS